MMSATASLGLILLWDVDAGLSQIDKYLYATEDFIKAGALLACGIVNCGVKNECDPALAILSEYVLHNTHIMRIGAIVGLGLAYAGSARDDIIEILIPVLSDEKSQMECVGMTALALGMIAVSTCNGEVTENILQTMMEKPEDQLKDPFAKYLALGLGLTYLGKQDAAEAVVAALEVVKVPLGTMARVMVEVCAYAGTGNVLKVQNLLHICSEHYETEKDKEKDKDKQQESAQHTSSGTGTSGDSNSKAVQDASHQAMAVLGIALIAGGEEIGAQMAMRSFSHLLQYGEPVIRRAVPLALGLISASNPQLSVLDTLSKLSHDTDAEVAHNAIFSLGLVGAGTNNARLAGMLRQLAMYYHKDANNLYMTRIAQVILINPPLLVDIFT
jgi:26S proteasome regulatory subunit N1